MNAPMMNGQEENLLDGVIILVRTENALNSKEFTKAYCRSKDGTLMIRLKRS